MFYFFCHVATPPEYMHPNWGQNKKGETKYYKEVGLNFERLVAARDS
jgi:hypothetical protein